MLGSSKTISNKPQGQSTIKSVSVSEVQPAGMKQSPNTGMETKETSQVIISRTPETLKTTQKAVGSTVARQDNVKPVLKISKLVGGQSFGIQGVGSSVEGDSVSGIINEPEKQRAIYSTERNIIGKMRWLPDDYQRVYLNVFDNPSSSVNEISEAVGIDEDAVDYILSYLVNEGILKKSEIEIEETLLEPVVAEVEVNYYPVSSMSKKSENKTNNKKTMNKSYYSGMSKISSSR